MMEIQDGVESLIGTTFGSVFPEGGLDGFNKFSFVHGNRRFCGCDPGLASENPLISKGNFQVIA
jgi:hypothetical protein